jgi:hypothetical protein
VFFINVLSFNKTKKGGKRVFRAHESFASSIGDRALTIIGDQQLQNPT